MVGKLVGGLFWTSGCLLGGLSFLWPVWWTAERLQTTFLACSECQPVVSLSVGGWVGWQVGWWLVLDDWPLAWRTLISVARVADC